MPIYIETEKGITEGLVAMNYFFFILIRPAFRHAKDVIEHEKVHSQQVFDYFIFQPILYNFSKEWRLKFEAEAYAASVYHGLSLERAAKFLYKHYKLGKTLAECKDAIKMAYYDKYQIVLMG